MGRGMRQSGILAAAGLYSFDYPRERLAQDDLRARHLAEEAGRLSGLSVELPDTNIVMLDIDLPGAGSQELQALLGEDGVLMVSFGPRRFRCVTHLEIQDEGLKRAPNALRRAMNRLAGWGGRVERVNHPSG